MKTVLQTCRRAAACSQSRTFATAESKAWAKSLNASLQETDPALFDIIEKEKQRQRNCISLIASEVRAAEYASL